MRRNTKCVNALSGLSCYVAIVVNMWFRTVSMPSRAWVVTRSRSWLITGKGVSMPSWAWVVTEKGELEKILGVFQCPLGLELLQAESIRRNRIIAVSMPSRAWVVTGTLILFCLLKCVSMPSRAWVVTARMSNILNFLWYFLCIPAIYKCILAYLSIFFNQLSEFLRCESPSTFLGTCLSHHSFIW